MLVEILSHTLMITCFVAVMMLVIEYINVHTRGVWGARLQRNRWGQYLLAVILGITPGCLGAFAVVAMYMHRSVTAGAVVAAMVATSGDAAFLLLAMVPDKAVYLFAVLAAAGFIAGALTDQFLPKRYWGKPADCDGLEIHEEFRCSVFSIKEIAAQWSKCSLARLLLGVGLAAFLAAVVLGIVEPEHWNWIRITLLVTTLVALFIVITVPDHFLEEHLWRHVILKHVPVLFLWTLGALAVMHLIAEEVVLVDAIQEDKWLVLVFAALVGLIPDSGPHLIFVTLFAQGTIPFSILLANSVVQDGHGMLPVLAHSRCSFVVVKMINFLIGVIVGSGFLLAGH
jgi:hypothetical protein